MHVYLRMYACANGRMHNIDWMEGLLDGGTRKGLDGAGGRWRLRAGWEARDDGGFGRMEWAEGGGLWRFMDADGLDGAGGGWRPGCQVGEWDAGWVRAVWME